MALMTFLNPIEFEHGAIGQLPAELAALGISRPLLVTDHGLVATGLAERISALLPPAVSVTLFADTPPNPTEAAVEAAAALYAATGCDGIVAVGGGSPLDLAKAAALRATHPAPLAQYAAILGGSARIRPGVPPIIAVPTTAGTGSEVGRGALITMADGRKLAIASPQLLPRKTLCDPDLTLSLPPGLTAATGMDALTHCVEEFLSPRVNPPADAIALDGAARAWRWIETATRDGSHREARWNMMMASLEGGLGFQKGLGAVHSMSHPLGSLASPVLHHGTLNAVILPAVLRFNAGHVGDKYDRLRQALGLAEGTDLAGAVTDLNRRLGLPPDLAAMGVTWGMAERLIPDALADHCTATNPRPLGAEEFAGLFREALGPTP